MSVTADMRWTVRKADGTTTWPYEFRDEAMDAQRRHQSMAESLGLGNEFAARSGVVAQWVVTVTLTPGSVGDDPSRAELIDAVLAELNAWPPGADLDEPSPAPSGSEGEQ